MLRASVLALAFAALATVTGPASIAAPSEPPPVASPAMLPLASQFDVVSKITGRTYRIYVSKPVAPPPKGGYPVLYVLDGDMAFPIAAGQVLLGSLTGRPPTLVVGVAYPNTLATMTLRQRDLTPTKPDAASLAISGPGAKADDFGGADDFHRFMMEELRPLIAAGNPIDVSRQSLMGYSLGGLFTLHVLFHHPEAYRSYVAGSPSIWWDQREVLHGEAAFEDAVRAGKAAPRMLITSDAWEQGEDAPDLPPPGELRTKILEGNRAARMVDNARELADRLSAIKGAPGFEVDYALFSNETHNSGIPASTSRGVAFVTRP